MIQKFIFKVHVFKINSLSVKANLFKYIQVFFSTSNTESLKFLELVYERILNI